MSDRYDVYYEGRHIGEAEAVEIQQAQAQQTRRSANINCHFDTPARRRGKSWALAMIALGAGCGFEHVEPLRLGPVRPAKHWVAPKDWTQREKRRSRR